MTGSQTCKDVAEECSPRRTPGSTLCSIRGRLPWPFVTWGARTHSRALNHFAPQRMRAIPRQVAAPGTGPRPQLGILRAQQTSSSVPKVNQAISSRRPWKVPTSCKRLREHAACGLAGRIDGDGLVIVSNGGFTFAVRVNSGNAYPITASMQPFNSHSKPHRDERHRPGGQRQGRRCRADLRGVRPHREQSQRNDLRLLARAGRCPRLIEARYKTLRRTPRRECLQERDSRARCGAGEQASGGPRGRPV
jgi:hypothetical protein